MQTTPMSMWIGFNVFILAMISLDLMIHSRKEHAINPKEAFLWSFFWIGLALGFNVLIYYTHGSKSAIEFFTGYLVEESLSVDNLFVFLLIFRYFKTPEHLQHRVLFYGILGAIIMRAVFIFGGIALVGQFKWLFYVFGFLLVFMGIKIVIQKETEIHPEKNPLVNWCSRWMSLTNKYHGENFFIHKEGKLYATPLFLTLLTVEFTDLLFAIDSIPAIFAITLDPFIVYTSNIFAILGLRALFFALKASLNLFHYLHHAIGIILTFIGIKMIIHPFISVSIWIALGFIATALTSAILLSLIFPQKKTN